MGSCEKGFPNLMILYINTKNWYRVFYRLTLYGVSKNLALICSKNLEVTPQWCLPKGSITEFLVVTYLWVVRDYVWEPKVTEGPFYFPTELLMHLRNKKHWNLSSFSGCSICKVSFKFCNLQVFPSSKIISLVKMRYD